MSELRKIELPEHLQAMTEFRLLDEVSDKMMSAFDDEIVARHDDLLITTATEEGIARRERILGIIPDPDASLEARRTTVLFWWYNRMPYTRRVLESKVAAQCGVGNYTFDYDPIEQILTVGILASLGWDVIYIVRSLLDRLVMLNVILDVKAVAVEAIESPLYLGAVEQNFLNIETIKDNAWDLEPIDAERIAAAVNWVYTTEFIEDGAGPFDFAARIAQLTAEPWRTEGTFIISAVLWQTMTEVITDSPEL